MLNISQNHCEIGIVEMEILGGVGCTAKSATQSSHLTPLTYAQNFIPDLFYGSYKTFGWTMKALSGTRQRTM